MGMSASNMPHKHLMPVVKDTKDEKSGPPVENGNGRQSGRNSVDPVRQINAQDRRTGQSPTVGLKHSGVPGQRVLTAFVPHADEVQILRQDQHQHAVPSYSLRTDPHPSGTRAEVLRNSKATAHVPAPLFERFHTEEATELKTYVRIIESQNTRLLELERVHDELEGRLEVEAHKRMTLERKLEDERRELEKKYIILYNEKETQMKLVVTEKKQNGRLREQLTRKEQEIRRFYQRKYDSKTPSQQNNHSQQRPQNAGNSFLNANLPSLRVNSPIHSPGTQGVVYHSPYELLDAKGSGDAVRELNVTTTLKDFFGL